MNYTNEFPKVTVGIPTYNRPDGLLRTIKQITSQTYVNIEIIISNNYSTDPMVKMIIDHCEKFDNRIKSHHQKENIGLVNNFKFLLKESSSDFFMWAADDDEWDVRFIEKCMIWMQSNNIGTVMPGFIRHNRALNLKGLALLPKMTGEDRFADAMAFYQTMPHSIFYGLHRKKTIEWFIKEDNDVIDDEHFLINQIINNGVFTFPEELLYCAGIDDASYQIKLPKEAPDRYFYLSKRLLNFANSLLKSTHINDKQKIILLQKAIVSKLNFTLNFEGSMRESSQVDLASQMFNFLSEFDMNSIQNYTKLIKFAKEFKES